MSLDTHSPSDVPAQARHVNNSGVDADLATLRSLVQQAVELAERTGDPVILRSLTNVRALVSARLAPPSARDQALMEWAQRHNMQGGSSFEIQGSMIRFYNNWNRGIARKIASETSVQYQGLVNDASYRTMKMLLFAFDPRVHGEDFEAYAEPFLQAGIRLCCARRELIIPDKVHPAERDEFLATLLIDASDLQSPKVPEVRVPEPMPKPVEPHAKEVTPAAPVTVSRQPVQQTPSPQPVRGMPAVVIGHVEVTQKLLRTIQVPADKIRPTSTARINAAQKSAAKAESSVPPKQVKPAESAPTTVKEPELEIDMETVNKNQRLIDYVAVQIQKSSKSDPVYDVVSAREWLQAKYEGTAKTTAHKVVKNGGVHKPQAKTVEHVAKKILAEALDSFDPQKSDGDYFRGHLQKLIGEKAVTLYKQS